MMNLITYSLKIILLVLLVNANGMAQTINKPTTSLYGFIENKGQIIDQNNNPNPSVLYLYSGNGLNVQLKKDGFSYEVVKTKSGNKQAPNPKGKFDPEKKTNPDTFFTHRIDISFVNANPNNSIVTDEPLKDYINYYTTATPEQGVVNVQHFNKITYKNIYPYIDIEFLINESHPELVKGLSTNFKYNIIVYAGGNPNDIQLKLEGANQTTLTKEGSILIETSQGNILEQIPYTYQFAETTTRHIQTKAEFYQLPVAIGQTPEAFGIRIPTYNPTQTLIIDPAPWATYYGNNNNDEGNGLTLDSLGNIIMVGATSSTTTIATSGVYQSLYSGGKDAMVVKFNHAGVRQWGTYYGGSADENAYKIVTDSFTNLIFTGYTNSTSSISSSGAHQTTLGGGRDAFLVKLNGSGLRQWATYYGGTGTENGNTIAVDSNRNIFLIGNTTSTTNISTTGVHQQSIGGGLDAFLVKFNSQGVRQWATYYGGSGIEEGILLAVDKVGNIFAGGSTNSTTGISTTGTHQSTLAGTYDGYFAKFNTSGVRQWATYYGGNSDDFALGLTLDSSNNILITGNTISSTGIATTGAFKTVWGGSSDDIFIAKLNTAGVRLWGTYYGGNAEDGGRDIKCDKNGNIFITGYTGSDSTIATLGTNQYLFGGVKDAFLVKFNAVGNRLWGTYFGGSGEEYAYSLIVSPNNDLFITGTTSSTNGISTPGAFSTTYGGGAIDAFLAAFTTNGTLPVKLVSFNAKLVSESKVLCSWATASEINNHYFEIERSLDNKNWLAIGKVIGAGNSNKLISYQFTDNSLLASNNQPTTLYYRLKQTDFDGTSSLSLTKTVQFNDLEQDQIKLYYNQNIPIIQFISSKENEVKLKLFGLSGNVLWQSDNSVMQGINSINIEPNLQSGIYLLQCQLEHRVSYFKIFINN
jgi:hypothetical protein